MSQFKRLVMEILDLQSLGLNDAEISRALQCSRGVVCYVVDQYGKDQ